MTWKMIPVSLIFKKKAYMLLEILRLILLSNIEDAVVF